MFILTACSSPDQAEGPSGNYFITEDLSFLDGGLPAEGAKAWPSNGCKEFEVKLKVAMLGEIKTTVLHCCVDYVCNAVALTEMLDFFLGDKGTTRPTAVELVSSGLVAFGKYDIRIHAGTYRLNAKTGRLEGLRYEVWVNR